MSTKPHIILTHGAFHRAWHWHLLQSNLENAGYKVTALNLPSTSDDTPESDALALDAEHIRASIEDVAKDATSILPVFHSYGGIPGSEALAQLQPETAKKIPHLVYLASFVCTPGHTVEDLMGVKVPPGEGRMQHVMIHPNPGPTFYNDLEPSLAAEAVAHLGPQARSAMTSKVKYAGWKQFPRTVIRCRDDKAVWWEMFDFMSEEEVKGWEVVEIEGGHSPFLSRVEETAGLVRRYAGEGV